MLPHLESRYVFFLSLSYDYTNISLFLVTSLFNENKICQGRRVMNPRRLVGWNRRKDKTRAGIRDASGSRVSSMFSFFLFLRTRLMSSFFGFIFLVLY